MPANFVLLEKITVGAAGASSVTFSSIPQTGYTDLVVKTSLRDTAATVGNAGMRVIFNGSGSGFSSRWVYGTGNAALSSSDSGSWIRVGQQPGANATANTFSNDEIYIPNYTGSANKSISADTVSENNGTEAYAYLVAGLWANSAAITSITIQSNSTAWAANSTFYLYGVAKLGTTPAIVPYATGGDIIDTDGTYWYHTFLSSGTFTPQKAITCDYLVVAGGGSGGWRGDRSGGGGGGGGLRCTVTATGGGGSLETPVSLGTSAYTVTIGAGGAGAVSNVTYGNNGNDSSIAGSGITTITSVGGGVGGFGLGGSGGSGGGSSGNNEGPGSGTTNQGYAGGSGSSDNSAGGGGGAGAVGGNASNGVGGNGGNGVTTLIYGTSRTYAGGGGGASVGTQGSGGSGGGAAGIRDSAGQNYNAGTANSGGGGGGKAFTTAEGYGGGAGGSGIVIIRYAV